MAAIGITSKDVVGVATDNVVTLTASDTFTYVPNVGMYAVFNNSTGGSLTVNLKGTAPSATYFVNGTGSTMDLTAGYSIVIAAGVQKSVNLDKISAYLTGTGVVTVTGAATLKATIYQ